MCVAANSHYCKIMESSQPPHPVIIQVKAGQVQQKEQREMRPYQALS